jgi:DNA-binding response OmpR family regulator
MSLRSQGRARKVLLVEDDPAIRSIISEVCRRGGYDVVEVATGRSALESVRGQEPDLVLLDWVLPDLSGIEVCRELRRRGADCPIVMLTGRTSKVDVVVGLEVGADDYITKPFDARELTARLAANLRRAGRASAGPSLSGLLRLGGMVIDVDGRRVLVGGKELRLTLTEFNLLRLLAANAGRVLSRDQLLEKVWGYEAEVDHHSVDPHVQRLRRKLTADGDSGVAVDAVPGLGYRLSVRS